MGQHRADHVGVAAGLEQPQQRVLGAVGIPDGEHRIVGKAFGLMDFPVNAAVASVHVHIDGRVDHRVIERRIEARLLVVGALALQYTEFLFPGAGGLAPDRLERLAGSLRSQVLQGPFRRDSRQGHLHLEFGHLGVELEIGRDVTPGNVREIVMQVELAPESPVRRLLAVGITIVYDGLGKGDGKVGIVASRPAVRNPVTRDKGIVHDPDPRPEHFAVIIVDAVKQVHYQTLGAAFRESILVDAHPLRSGKPRADAAVSERNFVEARLRMLRLVTEPLPITSVRIFFRAGVQLQSAGLGHEQDVTQVGMARSAQMGMAEADDRIVRILIASTVVIRAGLILPSDIVRNGIRVGRELHGPERGARTREAVSHARSADHRIDVLRHLGAGQA